ncbi:MAG: biotin/lipoyl-containing protein, partial [Flavobacteriales bacterium]
MPIVEITVPSPGESISEVEIAAFLKEDGDYVFLDEEICEVDSDKATLAIPAEKAGIITWKVEEGDAVDVGGVIATIDTDAKAPEGGAPEVKEEEPT